MRGPNPPPPPVVAPLHEMETNYDGKGEFNRFQTWREFVLFIPHHSPIPTPDNQFITVFTIAGATETVASVSIRIARLLANLNGRTMNTCETTWVHSLHNCLLTPEMRYEGIIQIRQIRIKHFCTEVMKRHGLKHAARMAGSTLLEFLHHVL